MNTPTERWSKEIEAAEQKPHTFWGRSRLFVRRTYESVFHMKWTRRYLRVCFFDSLRPHCLVLEPLILTSVLFASVFSLWRVAGRWPRYSHVRPWRSLSPPPPGSLTAVWAQYQSDQSANTRLHHPILAAVRSPDITSGWAARVAGRGPLTGWLARSLFKHEMLLPLIVDLCFTFVLFMQFLSSLQKGRREAQMWLELNEWCAKKKKKKRKRRQSVSQNVLQPIIY